MRAHVRLQIGVEIDSSRDNLYKTTKQVTDKVASDSPVNRPRRRPSPDRLIADPPLVNWLPKRVILPTCSILADA